LHEVGKVMQLLSDLMKVKYVALKRIAEDGKEWQSYTYFLADYLKKKKTCITKIPLFCNCTVTHTKYTGS